MPRTRRLPPVPDLLADLAEQGVVDAPRAAPDEGALQALLDVALFVAEHRKRVSFPGFTWDDPVFVSQDAKLAMRLPFVRLPRDVNLEGALRAHLPRAATGHALLAVDASATALREFDVGHALYGSVTLHGRAEKPPESADPRVDAARERGWTRTLKEHNLLPGRGLVVLDEHQGLYLRDPAFDRLMGILLLLPDGHTTILWNPFVEAERNDAENQYWLGWGDGRGQSSEWRELMRYEGEPEG